MPIRIASFLAVAVLCACAVQPPAGSLAGEVTIARFSLDIDGLESGFPQPGDGLIPDIAEAHRVLGDIREAIETLRTPEGTVVKTTADAVLAQIEQALSTRSRLTLAPVETLRGRVPYLLGFPQGDAKALARQGVAPLLAEIDVDVSVPDQGTGYFAWLGTGTAKTSGHPEMILQISVVDAAAKVVWRDQIILRSPDKVVLDERWLLGVNVERSVSDGSSLPALARRATETRVDRSTLRRG